jgi:hypothetical protein
MPDGKDESSAFLLQGVAELLGNVGVSEPASSDAEPTTAPEPVSPPAVETPEQASPTAPQTSPAKGEPTPAFPDRLATLSDDEVDWLLENHKRAQTQTYRRAQAMKDKEIANLQKRQEQEAQAHKVQEMDDEEYGRYLREVQAQQSQVQPVVQQRLYEVLSQIHEHTLSAITDEGAREAVLAKTPEFASYTDFLKAAIEAEAEHRTRKAVEREVAKVRKEVYETARKEAQAELSESVTPEVRTGLPPRGRVLHGQEAISAGFAEQYAEVLKKGK